MIHTDLEQVNPACLKARESFKKCQQFYSDLAQLIPPSNYYRFSDHWNWTTQRIISLIGLVVYLETNHLLVSRDTCAEILGLFSLQSEGFHLDLEMYLMGVLQMVSELSRFAINSVTLGDYNRVLSLQGFVGNINSGFRLLNLKNDSLRKRFDSLKYDVKKIEEIVYDLTIRGLLQKPVVEMETVTEVASNNTSMKED